MGGNASITAKTVYTIILKLLIHRHLHLALPRLPESTGTPESRVAISKQSVPAAPTPRSKRSAQQTEPAGLASDRRRRADRHSVQMSGPLGLLLRLGGRLWMHD